MDVIGRQWGDEKGQAKLAARLGWSPRRLYRTRSGLREGKKNGKRIEVPTNTFTRRVVQDALDRYDGPWLFYSVFGSYLEDPDETQEA